jgi:hypothetical protein
LGVGIVQLRRRIKVSALVGLPAEDIGGSLLGGRVRVVLQLGEVKINIIISHAEALDIKLLEITKCVLRYAFEVDSKEVENDLLHLGIEAIVYLLDPVLSDDFQLIQSFIVLLA